MNANQIDSDYLLETVTALLWYGYYIVHEIMMASIFICKLCPDKRGKAVST
jgi:hypothetical protein